MVKAKFITRNDICIIDNGRSYIFNSLGKCISEDAGLLPKYTDGVLALPILSILSSCGCVEIALFNFDGVSMRRYSTKLDSVSCAIATNSYGKFLRMLRREGRCGNKSFNQLLFVYNEDTSSDDLILKLQLEEIKDEHQYENVK